MGSSDLHPPQYPIKSPLLSSSYTVMSYPPNSPSKLPPPTRTTTPPITSYAPRYSTQNPSPQTPQVSGTSLSSMSRRPLPRILFTLSLFTVSLVCLTGASIGETTLAHLNIPGVMSTVLATVGYPGHATYTTTLCSRSGDTPFNNN